MEVSPGDRILCTFSLPLNFSVPGFYGLQYHGEGIRGKYIRVINVAAIFALHLGNPFLLFWEL